MLRINAGDVHLTFDIFFFGGGGHLFKGCVYTTAVSRQSLAILDIFSNQATQNHRFLQFGLLFFNSVKRF